MTALLNELDRTVIDWSDFSAASEQSTELVQRLAADPPALRLLVDRMRGDESLMRQCERHRLLDRLVVYDALDRGFRLRLHFSTASHLDRPHDHRFSFTTHVLSGTYTHVRHHIVGDLAEASVSSGQEAKFAVPIDVRYEPQLVTVEEPGSSYSLHHSEIHTTITTPGLTTLFLRGPAEKERSMIAERETAKLWWRYGEKDETEERRRRKIMDSTIVDSLVQRLSDLRLT